MASIASRRSGLLLHQTMVDCSRVGTESPDGPSIEPGHGEALGRIGYTVDLADVSTSLMAFARFRFNAGRSRPDTST